MVWASAKLNKYGCLAFDRENIHHLLTSEDGGHPKLTGTYVVNSNMKDTTLRKTLSAFTDLILSF